jgi:WD40 repeat protein
MKPKKDNSLLSLVILLSLLGMGADKKGLEPIPVVSLNRRDAVGYDKEVAPIFANKCQACHSGSVTKGKFDVSRYEFLLQGGKRGKAILPGQAADSLLVKLAGRTQKPFMPPKGEDPLTPAELALIKAWIDQGAKGSGNTHSPATISLGALPSRVHPVHAVAVSPDKSIVAAGRGNQIHLYQVETGSSVRTLCDPNLTTAGKKPLRASHSAIVEALAFSPDGKTLASGSFEEVSLWDVTAGALRTKLTGFADRVVAVTFSPNGKLLAAGGGLPTAEGEIKVFEAATGKLVTDVKNGHSDTVFGVCFSPDSTKLATCGADKFVKVFEIPSGKFIKGFEGHTHQVLDVGWKADGKLLASAGADNVIKVWDYEKGEQVRTMAGHGKQVTRLLFIGATAQIATCSGDQTVRLWNVDNGAMVRSLGGGADFLYAVGVSSDGSIVAAGGEDGAVRLYQGKTGQLVKELIPPQPPKTAAMK